MLTHLCDIESDIVTILLEFHCQQLSRATSYSNGRLRRHEPGSVGRIIGFFSQWIYWLLWAVGLIEVDPRRSRLKRSQEQVGKKFLPLQKIEPSSSSQVASTSSDTTTELKYYWNIIHRLLVSKWVLSPIVIFKRRSDPLDHSWTWMAPLYIYNLESASTGFYNLNHLAMHVLIRVIRTYLQSNLEDLNWNGKICGLLETFAASSTILVGRNKIFAIVTSCVFKKCKF